MSMVMDKNIKRWTVYYRPVKASPKVRAMLDIPIKAMIDQSSDGDWTQFYNHRRPHQALAMKTPAEAYALGNR